MGPFASGLGLLILVVVLLFTWFLVVAFVSPELAALMGFGVLALWFLLFVPSGFIKELLWRSRQKKLMDTALSSPAYQPGTALPPPGTFGAIGGGTSGALMTTDQPGTAGSALDLYRELPQLPQLEPRDHLATFKRSLILVFVGISMIWGGTNEAVVHAIFEARGIAEKLPIATENLKLPHEQSYYQDNLMQAARLTLRREADCHAILGGRLAEEEQFSKKLPPQKQIANGQLVYELICQHTDENSKNFLAWVTSAELDQGSLSAATSFFDKPPTLEETIALCDKAVNEQLDRLNSHGTLMGTPTATSAAERGFLFHVARSPFAGYARLSGIYALTRETGQPGGQIEASCWTNRQGPAAVRFLRSN